MVFIRNIPQNLGVLRGLLSLLAITLIVATPFSDVSLPPVGWGMLRSVILPVAGPMTFIVLMLDMMMSLIFKSQFEPGSPDGQKFGFIALWNLIIGLILIAVWIPVFLRATGL